MGEKGKINMRNINPEVRKRRLEYATKLLLSSSEDDKNLGREHILDLSYLPHNEKTVKGDSVYFFVSSLLDKFSTALFNESVIKRQIERFVIPSDDGIILEWNLGDTNNQSVFVIFLGDNGSFATNIQTESYTETHVLAKNQNNIYDYKGMLENRSPISGKRMIYR